MRLSNRSFWTAILLSLSFLSTPFRQAIAAAPKDTPQEENGEGPTGNDWEDYGSLSSATLWYRRDSENIRAPRLFITITSTNPNHALEHARTTAGSRVSHLHYDKDYGDDFGGEHGTITAAEGDDFFNWTYDQYTPEPIKAGSATGYDNCVSWAYHQYKSSSTRTMYWVNSGAASAPYRNELFEIAEYGNNGNYDTSNGDRCDDKSNHVWVIGGSLACEPGWSLGWKNNTSAVYVWHPDPDTNDCPKGDRPENGLYGDYAIYNKEDR